MRNYTSAYRKSKNEKFIAARLRAEKNSRQRSRLVIKTNACDEIRVTFAMDQAPIARAAGGAPLGAATTSAASNLVYNGESQLSVSKSPAERFQERSPMLSKYGGHTIKEGCSVIEQRYRRKAMFLTFTLPGDTTEAIKAVAENSQPILNALLQRMRAHHRLYLADRAKTNESELFYCGVWEYQERGALHIHMVVPFEDREWANVMRRKHRGWWKHVLETYSEKLGVDLWGKQDGTSNRGQWYGVVTQCKQVKKSVGRYMSKYVSKGARERSATDAFPPARWWFMSRPLRAEVQAQRQSCVVMYDAPGMAERNYEIAAALINETAGTTFGIANPYTETICGRIGFDFDGAKAAVYAHLCELFGNAAHADHLETLWEMIGIPPDIEAAKIAA